jgi:thymidylate synthase (FAD)
MSMKFFLPGNEGFVERLEVFGSDLTVVNAARVSFAKESHEMTKRDGGLIRYLANHDHISPFFHPQIRFRLRMPIFVAREWFRHTIGFARNEVSRRYVDDRPACWVPITGIRARNENLKQGSADHSIEDEGEMMIKWNDMQKQVVDFYDYMLDKGVAPEVARGILPQSMYTEFIETGSLYAYARLCQLRLHPQAQAEIRRYADLIDKCLSSVFPVSWEALKAKWVVAEVPVAEAAPVTVTVTVTAPEAQPTVEQVEADLQAKLAQMSIEGVGHVVGC